MSKEKLFVFCIAVLFNLFSWFSQKKFKFLLKDFLHLASFIRNWEKIRLAGFLYKRRYSLCWHAAVLYRYVSYMRGLTVFKIQCSKD